MPAHHRSSLQSISSTKIISGARMAPGQARRLGSEPCKNVPPKSRRRMSSSSSSIQSSQHADSTSCFGKLFPKGLPSSRANASTSGFPRTLKRSALFRCGRRDDVKHILQMLISINMEGSACHYKRQSER